MNLGNIGRYQIKSGRLSGEYVARAFPKSSTNARGLIAEAKGATEEAAIAALHNVLDAREKRRADNRRVDELTGVPIPSAEEFREAVDQVSLSGPQRAMLTALAFADADGLTEMRLRSAAGYASYTSANRALAAAGQLIANYLSMDVDLDVVLEQPEGAMFLAYRGETGEDEDQGNWVLHAELRAAIRTGPSLT